MAGLRILQVNKFYPPHIGGIETVVQQVSEGLKDRAQVSVLVCQPGARASGRNTAAYPSPGAAPGGR